MCMYVYTGYTQKNGAVLIVNTIKTAPVFCVCPVYTVVYYIYLKLLPSSPVVFMVFKC
jgi:hypothetical protein